VSELDDLLLVDGVFTAGRFGPDGRIAEQKSVASAGLAPGHTRAWDTSSVPPGEAR